MSASHKVRRVKGHDCNLPQDDELITFYINGGLFVDFRRNFRKYLMVSPTNPETKTALRSTAQIRLEEGRHLRKYYYMIHPFSEARITWDMIMIVVYSTLMFVMPIDLGIIETPDVIIYIKTILDIISLMDIGMHFFTGFYNINTHKVVLKQKKILLKYFKTFFFFDLLSSLPYQCIIYFDNVCSEDIHFLKYFYLLKLTRLPTLISFIRRLCIKLNIYSYKLPTINFLIWFVTLIFWGSCLTLLMQSTLRSLQDDDDEKTDTDDLIYDFIGSFYEIVRAYVLVQIATNQIAHALPMTFNIFFVLIGCVLNIVILALVMQIFRQHFSSRNKYDDLVQQIGEYMNYKELPQNTKKRVFQYVEFKFQKNVFKEGDIINTLSRVMQQEVLMHNCKKMVEKVDFFKDVPSTLILRLLTKLKSEIFLPNDVIVEAGIPGNAMYFIYVGSVAVYTKNNEEICHLEDGSHFGEIALIINEPRVATVIAITNCEVYRLSRKDFLEAIEPYPNLSNKIRESGLSRLKNTQQMMKKPKRIQIIK